MSNLLRLNTPSLINIEVGAAPLTLMPTQTPPTARELGCLNIVLQVMMRCTCGDAIIKTGNLLKLHVKTLKNFKI